MQLWTESLVYDSVSLTNAKCLSTTSWAAGLDFYRVDWNVLRPCPVAQCFMAQSHWDKNMTATIQTIAVWLGLIPIALRQISEGLQIIDERRQISQSVCNQTINLSRSASVSVQRGASLNWLASGCIQRIVISSQTERVRLPASPCSNRTLLS